MAQRKVKGKIIIISSPSGGGKTSICNELLRRNKDWKFSISVTTRKKRPNEKNGREYWFAEHSDFLKMRARGDFAEWCKVHSFLYGTPRWPMESILYGGGVMLLDVDVKGAKKLKKIYREAATIFILPPTRVELKRRLKKRGTEDDKHFKIRQSRALSEMKLFRQFEYTVVNKDLDTAVNEVEMIVKSLHCRKNNLDLEQINRIVG
ncbi:MAG: guanylate kinase [Candidatus Zixiibacteriota bacterium]